jgi:quercetin dioxygenase-like cupin family protein
MSRYFVEPPQCSRHTIFPGVHIHTTCGEAMMLSLVAMEPGARVEPHSHPHEQMGLLIKGELEFHVGDETRRVRPGEMWRIPGGVTHWAVAGPLGAEALDVFHPIREDYR